MAKRPQIIDAEFTPVDPPPPPEEKPDRIEQALYIIGVLGVGLVGRWIFHALFHH